MTELKGICWYKFIMCAIRYNMHDMTQLMYIQVHAVHTVQIFQYMYLLLSTCAINMIVHQMSRAQA